MTEPSIATPAGDRPIRNTPVENRRPGVRETVIAALTLSAAAHAGAVYWAVSSAPLREAASSAGGSVAVEIVLVQGPGAPPDGGRQGSEGKRAEGNDAGERSGPERSGDRAINRDTPVPAAQPEEVAAPAADPLAPPEPASSAAVQHAPVTEAPSASAAAQAAPPPPPPKPARTETASKPPAEVARAAPAAPTVPPAAQAAQDKAGAPAGTTGAKGERDAPDGSEGTEAAAPLADNPAPDYPYAARLRGQHGRVLLFVEVLATGEAGAVTVERSSGHESLDRAAAQAVQRWRFRPARRNGAPVAARVEVPIRFALQ